MIVDTLGQKWISRLGNLCSILDSSKLVLCAEADGDLRSSLSPPGLY